MVRTYLFALISYFSLHPAGQHPLWEPTRMTGWPPHGVTVPPPPPLSPGGLGQNRPFCCSPVSAAVRACLHPWSLCSDPQGFSPIPYICPHLFTTGRLQHTLLSLPEKLFSYTSPPFLFPLCLCLKICSKGDPVPGLSITLPWGMLQSRTAAERGCAAPQGHPPRAPDGSQGTPRTLP